MSEYLAIDGWEEFQKYRGRRAGFILDATDQFERRKLTGLSLFARGVLQELRRLRGRTGENILYDIAHIARSIHALPTDRPHLKHAIDTLISRGILLLTNQQVDFVKVPEKENKKEKDKELIQSPPAPVIEKAKPVLFEKAYEQYPRHLGKRAAEKAWHSALGRRKAEHSVPEAEEFIYQRVMTFAAVCERIHKPREFIPHMATWLNQSRFLDDPGEWAVTNSNGNGNGSGQQLSEIWAEGRGEDWKPEELAKAQEDYRRKSGSTTS